MWATEGEDFTLLVEYLVEGEFVVPDSATATRRDNDGVLISTDPLSVASTSAPLIIPAVENTVAAGMDYENRFLVINFVHDGKTYYQTRSYKVAPFVPLTATPGDVRWELGLAHSELPDEDIRIREAYLTLKAEYGTVFTDALSEGNQPALAAHRAVAVQAALDLVDSLEFRVAVKIKAEDSGFDRMSEFDVEAIRIRLGSRLMGLLDVALGQTAVDNTLFVLSTPTDAITGA